MIEISSENIDIFKFLKESSYLKITFDIETLDSKDMSLWNEPIISFSLSFVPDKPLPMVSYFPTFSFGIPDRNMEKELLMKLNEIFRKIPVNAFIIGHSVSYELECKKAGNWTPYSGYDIPKVISRGNLYNIDFNFMKEFKINDIFDIAYFHLDHEEHHLKNSVGGVKKYLRCEEIEELFNIIRPTSIPKLGPKVRIEFEKGEFQKVLLYNCSDTIIESIIYRIFDHKLNYCRQSPISYKRNCEHIPDVIKIDEVETWKRLKK